MNGLPQDPIILLSYVNTQLRDNYPSLQEMCDSMGVDEEEIRQKLVQAGFEYSMGQNRFF